MKEPKKYDDFEESYTLAEGVKEILETGSPNDEVLFAELLAKNNHAAKFIDKISSEEEFEKEHERLEKAYENNDSDMLLKKINKIESAKRVKRILLIASSAAASIAVMVMFVMMGNNNEITPITLLSKNIKTPTIIFEDSTQLEIMGKERYVSNQFPPSTKDSTHNGKRQLIVPSGHTFTIVLHDNTEITLNANSRLTYPSIFDKENRMVELEGEAYFKVTKSTKPFVVKVNNIEICVYGTEFNIKSSEHSTKTVLVTGSVGIRMEKGEEVILTPNHMATVENGICTVTNADVDRYIAWTKGFIQCDEEPIAVFLDDIERWYGIKIECNKSDFSDIPVSVSIRRDLTIQEVIQAIETTLNKKIIYEGGGRYVIE